MKHIPSIMFLVFIFLAVVSGVSDKVSDTILFSLAALIIWVGICTDIITDKIKEK